MKNSDDYRYVDIWRKAKPRPKWVRVNISDLPARFGELGYGSTDIYSTILRYSHPDHTPGEAAYGPLYFDFDAGHDVSMDEVLDSARRLLVWLEQELGIDEGVRLWFSGNRGIHITVDERVLDIQPNPLLHKVYCSVATYLADTLDLKGLDLAIYSSRRMWRYPDSVHSKTNLHKIELDFSELSLPSETIRERARKTRDPISQGDDLQLDANETATEWIRQFAEEVDADACDQGFTVTVTESSDQLGLPIVTARCQLFEYCHENARTLSEPLWYAMISNLCRFRGGNDKIHELSKPYSGYTAQETNAKIEQATSASGPMSCETIRELGFDCPGDCGVKSPAGLAYQKVFVEDGCYQVWKSKKDKNGKLAEYRSVPISNFRMQIERNMSVPNPDREEECIRQVRLIGTDGTQSGIVGLAAGSMVTPHEFKKFSLARGNYFWSGGDKELQDMLKLELSKNSGLVYRPDRIGYVADGRFWLFGNKAVPEGAEPIYPDDDGVIWVNGKGYLPLPFEGADDGESVLPVVAHRDGIEEYGKEVLDTIYNNLEFKGWMALGYCAAHVYLPEIVREFRSFPLFFLYGKLKAGKNMLARWMLNFFGLAAPEKTISETSQNWVARAMAYYSAMPVWLDEYRNERQVKAKNGILRNAYDRIGSGKGHLGFGGTGYPIRSSVILSGQVVPDDSALLSRCCVVHLSQQHRDDQYFDAMNRLSGDLSAILVCLIRNKTKESTQEFLSSVREYRDNLMERGIDSRDATNYSVVMAGVKLMPHQGQMLRAFEEWIYVTESERDKLMKDEENELSIFLEDMCVLMAKDRIGQEFYRVSTVKDKLYLWFAAVYNPWATHYRQRTGEPPFGRSAIIDYLKEEPYFVENDKQVWIGGHNRRCIVLELSKLPEHIRDAFVDTPMPSES